MRMHNNPLARVLNRRRERWHGSYVKRAHIAPLLASVRPDAVILEIGGGYNPRFRKATHPNTYHLDHASAAELRAKYSAEPSVAHLIGNIQEIDFVFDGRPIDTLVPGTLRFDLIYGSHVLEHQVDLVGHLQSLERLLRPGGRVIEFVPDLRACFDALRLPTVTSDALLAHMRPAPVHRGKQVFDVMSRELDTNLGHRMSDADFDGVRCRRDIREAYAAMLAAERDGAPFRDTHAWTFTPESFRLLMIELRLLGLVGLAPTYVSPRYGNQFCAVLEPAGDGADGPSAEVRQHLEAERMALAVTLRPR